jgi:hypothetical protein
MTSGTFQFTMREGPTPGKVFSLSKSELTIGRELNNDIVINAAEVSRKHTRLIFQAGNYVIEDLGSTNGTFVNGQRLSGPHVLMPGDHVMLGDAVALVYESAAYDPNATMVSSPMRPSTQPPQPQAPPPYVPPQQQYQSPPVPSYSGQVPQGPSAGPQYGEPEPEDTGRRTWLLAGIGCLVVLCIVVVAGAFIFDAMNLYCTPPFNAVFACP